VTAEPVVVVPDVMSKLGKECLVRSTDMPHHDTSRHERIDAEFLGRGDLTERQLRQTLRGNGARLDRSPVDDLADLTDDRIGAVAADAGQSWMVSR
jgi:hypothetical protein